MFTMYNAAAEATEHDQAASPADIETWAVRRWRKSDVKCLATKVSTCTTRNRTAATKKCARGLKFTGAPETWVEGWDPI